MIINSDIDLYEKKKEKNKLKEGDDSIFLKSIKDKTAKLNRLIETLFLLTRMEENLSLLKFQEIDI
jgi:K+-sensing histidine kinase KdpD